MKIQILNGSQKGKQIPVKEGFVFSRSKKKGNIIIQDLKVSSPHAEIVKKKTRFYLKDLNSKNGTYVDEKIDDFFILKPKLEFRIGRTRFRVEPSQKKPDKKKQWPFLIEKELKFHLPLLSNQKVEMKSIHPPLVLKIQSGIQKSQVWSLHYGPREVGSASLDLPILDPLAPAICFSLHPRQSGVLFKTRYPEKVLVNKKSLSKKILNPGDLISIANTYIEVIQSDVN